MYPTNQSFHLIWHSEIVSDNFERITYEKGNLKKSFIIFHTLVGVYDKGPFPKKTRTTKYLTNAWHEILETLEN